MAEFDDEDEELETGDESDPAKRRKPLEEAADAKLNPSPSIGTPIVPPQQPGPAAALAQPKSIGTPMMQEAPPDLGTGLTTPQSIGSAIAPQGQPALPHRPSSSDPEFQPQAHHGARALLDHLAVGAATYGSPQLGEATAHRLFDQPKIDAANKLKTAQGGYDTEFAQGEKQRTDKAIEDQREALAEKARQPAKQTLENPNQGYADAIRKVLEAGGDPNTDPHVKAWADAITAIQKDPAAKTQTFQEQSYDEWKQTHPKGTRVEFEKETKAAERAPSEPGSFQPLYGPKGEVTGFYNSKTLETRPVPKNFTGNTAGGAHIATTADTAQQKAVKPYQDMLDAQEEAHNLQKMADTGNAEADVNLALAFFKMMKGAGGSGVRFTKQESDLIMHARGAGQDLLGIGQKVLGEGQPFTPDQRQKVVQIIDMHADAAKQALQRLQGGGGSGAAAPTGGAAPLGGPAPKTAEEYLKKRQQTQP